MNNIDHFRVLKERNNQTKSINEKSFWGIPPVKIQMITKSKDICRVDYISLGYIAQYTLIELIGMIMYGFLYIINIDILEKTIQDMSNKEEVFKKWI